MKVLLVHNYYQQRGGEDASVDAEAALLERFDHEVQRYTVHNQVIDRMAHLRVAGRTLWSRQSHRELSERIKRDRPDVVHCSNTFPLISPSAYYAAQKAGLAVVQSLHNYRLSCLNGFHLRRGAVCEKCLGKPLAWAGIKHGCYRGSRPGSAVVAARNAVHQAAGTWTAKVDHYFAMTEFARGKSIEAGVPAERISVKPNFLDPDPGDGAPMDQRAGHVLFVGRLSPEKGLETLIDAWRVLDQPIELKIAGDGPMRDDVREAAAGDGRITMLGQQSAEQVLALLGQASCLVMPSIWYETFGRTIMEAFARGTPAVVSDLGAMAELVEPGRTGRRVSPGDAGAWAMTIAEMLCDSDRLSQMGQAARRCFVDRYTAKANHEMLMSGYHRAIEGARCPKHESPTDAWTQKGAGA